MYVLSDLNEIGNNSNIYWELSVPDIFLNTIHVLTHLIFIVTHFRDNKNRGIEKLHNLPEFTQQVNSRVKLEPRSLGLETELLLSSSCILH